MKYFLALNGDILKTLGYKKTILIVCLNVKMMTVK